MEKLSRAEMAGHVLEFKPIYRGEAKARERLSEGRGKKKVGINNPDLFGGYRKFVARDAAVSEHSIQRVLYIRKLAARRMGELCLPPSPAEAGAKGGRGKKAVRISDVFPERQRLSEFRKLAEGARVTNRIGVE